MSKSFPVLIVFLTAVFALAGPSAAQTTPGASPQRSTESVPVCVPTTTTTPEPMTRVPTVTVYNPLNASTPALTFYNSDPNAFPPPPLTFFTPLGQIDPPIRVLKPPSPPVQAMPAAPTPSSQPSFPATQTIASPGPCPPGTQLERLAR